MKFTKNQLILRLQAQIDVLEEEKEYKKIPIRRRLIRMIHTSHFSKLEHIYKDYKTIFHTQD